jgi:hypothetical protein
VLHRIRDITYAEDASGAHRLLAIFNVSNALKPTFRDFAKARGFLETHA